MTGDRQVYHTGSDEFGITVSHYGDAEGTKDAFSKSNPEAINGIIQENYSAYSFATQTIASTLDQIKADLAGCWEGSPAADEAMGIIATMGQDAQTIGTNTKACGDSLAQFQSDWARLKGEASGLSEGFLGTGLNADDGGAHRVFQQFTQSMQTSMHAMPSELYYHTSLNNDPNSIIDPPRPPPGPLGPGPGPGPLGPGPGPGPVHPVGPGSTIPHLPDHPIGPGSTGPGGIGPGGIGPGGIGPGGIGPGGIGPGGFGPGAGIDTSSQLAGFDGAGGAGPGGGGGLGGGGLSGGGGGLGAGAGGLGSSTAGLGASGAGAGGAGLAGGGVAGAGAGGRGMGGMMPMMGGGQQGGGQDRERNTWLAEDDDVWGGDEAPPGVIA